MDKKLLKKIKKIIDGEPVYSEPRYIHENEDGTITQEYFESITIDGVQYTYYIDWTGVDDGEDGGAWSEPYYIEED